MPAPMNMTVSTRISRRWVSEKRIAFDGDALASLHTFDQHAVAALADDTHRARGEACSLLVAGTLDEGVGFSVMAYQCRRRQPLLLRAGRGGDFDFEHLAGMQGGGALVHLGAQQNRLAGRVDRAADGNQPAADVALGELDRHTFLERGGHPQRHLDFQPQRREPGDAVDQRRRFDALAELPALFEHDAVDRCGQRQRSAQFARRDAGQRQSLLAFAGLCGGLAGGGARSLQAGFGDEAFGEQLFVALQALAQQGRLAAGLKGVALQFQRLRAGQAGEHLTTLDRSAGGDGEHFEHPGDRRGDDAHLFVGHQYARRINARALLVGLPDGCCFDAQCPDLGLMQRQRVGGMGSPYEQRDEKGS